MTRWLKSAAESRFQQLELLAAANPGAAVAIDERIERQTAMLERDPLAGREGRIAGTRELVIGRSPFIAVYRLGTNGVEMLAIVHGARVWPAAAHV